MQSYSVDNVHLYRSDVIRSWFSITTTVCYFPCTIRIENSKIGFVLELLGVWKKGVDAITCAVDGTIGKISESQVRKIENGLEPFGC